MVTTKRGNGDDKRGHLWQHIGALVTTKRGNGDDKKEHLWQQIGAVVTTKGAVVTTKRGACGNKGIPSKPICCHKPSHKVCRAVQSVVTNHIQGLLGKPI